MPGGKGPKFCTSFDKKEGDVAESYRVSAQEFLDENPNGAVFDFVLQVASDGHFDIEHGNDKWDETISPYVKVGTLTIVKQSLGPDTELNMNRRGDAMQFNPWNQLKAHRPLGPLQRARKDVYAAHGKIRRDKEGRPLQVCPFADLLKKEQKIDLTSHSDVGSVGHGGLPPVSRGRDMFIPTKPPITHGIRNRSPSGSRKREGLDDDDAGEGGEGANDDEVGCHGFSVGNVLA